MKRSINLADLFEITAEEVPDRLALVSGDQRRTYGELDARANQLARHLAAKGFAEAFGAHGHCPERLVRLAGVTR